MNGPVNEHMKATKGRQPDRIVLARYEVLDLDQKLLGAAGHSGSGAAATVGPRAWPVCKTTHCYTCFIVLAAIFGILNEAQVCYGTVWIEKKPAYVSKY